MDELRDEQSGIASGLFVAIIAVVVIVGIGGYLAAQQLAAAPSDSTTASTTTPPTQTSTTTTSPLSQDTDADGLTDGQEEELGTDPLSPEYIAIEARQEGDTLVVVGDTSLPDGIQLVISIPLLGISTNCEIKNHQYEYILKRSINDVSGKLAICASSDLAKVENSLEFNWVGVNKPPLPQFTYVVDGHVVRITDESADTDGVIVSWRWGPGAADAISDNSDPANPTFIYSWRGKYRVELTVTDNGGAQATSSAIVPVPDIYSFSWTFDSRSWSYELAITDELDRYESMPDRVYVSATNPNFVEESDIKRLVTPRDPVIKSVAENLQAMFIEEYGMVEDNLANFVLKFVQSAITYSPLSTDDYEWSYALEALVAEAGVCADKSVLYVSLLEAIGYHTCLIRLPDANHMVPAVHLDKRPSMARTWIRTENVSIEGVDYWPGETTSSEWNLGERPDEDWYQGWYTNRQLIQISSP